MIPIVIKFMVNQIFSLIMTLMCYIFFAFLGRFFDLVQYPIHPKMKRFWWVVWTFISPVAMVSIFFGSIIHELVEPLTYTVFGVSF